MTELAGNNLQTQTVHGTCIAIEGIGVLLRGPSGMGKSDLALRLIADGASLVADDYCMIERKNEELRVSPPPAIAGMLEVRGLGIVRLSPLTGARLRVVVDLVDGAEVPRLPERQTTTILGIEQPLFRLAPFELSSAAKVHMAVRLTTGRLAVVS